MLLKPKLYAFCYEYDMLTLFDDTDFFNSGKLKITHFNIPDAELTLYEHFFNREESDAYYQTLMDETPWKQEPITIHGKTRPTPRLTAWFGKRRGGEIENPVTPTLQTIKEKIELQTGIYFTSVLLNLYRTGQDSVSWHRDHEREYGNNPVIGSVSFGETRPFRIRHKFNKEVKQIEIPLNHGSFLLMAGAMQHFWEHQIPKTTRDIKPRINLTFRIVQ
jgi:alkylated DNA repair dioxygenase AlkB